MVYNYQLLRNDSWSPEPTLCFIKKKGLSLILKLERVSVSQNPDFKLVSQNWGLKAERAERKIEAPNIPVDLRPSPQLWS